MARTDRLSGRRGTVAGRACWAALAVLVAAAWAAGADEVPVDLSKLEFSKDEGAAAQAVPGGVRFDLDMGTLRTNWNHARWSVAQLSPPLDLSRCSAVTIRIATQAPTPKAGVYLALKEPDGSWYYATWAANLTRKTNEGVVRFDDLALSEWCSPPGGNHHDENLRFDPDKIAAVAVGCINPFGIGKVSFTLTELKAVSSAGPAPDVVKTDVTGSFLDVNGTDRIPPGVFGSFCVPPSERQRCRLGMVRSLGGRPRPAGPAEAPQIMIYCHGERTNTAPRLAEARWKENLAAAGKAFGEAAKAAGGTPCAEFWNEPYLNWANYTRVNFHPDCYDETKAVEGGPVHFKSDASVAKHLKWTKLWKPQYGAWCSRREWRRGRSADGKVFSPMFARPAPWSKRRRDWRPDLHPPDDVNDGETYTVTIKDRSGEKQLTLQALTPWHIVDETQFTYWSGSGMVEIYVPMMLAYGEALKAACPDATYIVGWGMRPSEDTWASFRMLYQPTIDAGVRIIDGVDDHDYGGDPTKMAANYEVVTAYGVTRHDKWLTCWNTEQGAQTDPQAYPEADGDLNRSGIAALIKMRWVSRKLLSLLCHVPDKARAVAHFGYGNWWDKNGQGTALELLKHLRGRLLHVRCDDALVYVVAAVDGTDPRCPRPKDMPAGKELVVAVLNDHPAPRAVALTVAAPAGTRFTQAAFVRRMVVREHLPIVEEAGVKWSGSGTAFSLTERIDPHDLRVVRLPLAGEPAETAPVKRRQFFGKTILADVTPGAPVKDAVAVDPACLKAAGRAWIRFVAEKLADGEGAVVLNGRELPLPAAATPENTPQLRLMAIDPAALKPDNELIVKVADDRHAGFLLGAISIMVETP